MNKKIILWFALLALMCILFGIYFITYRNKINNKAPVIIIDENLISVSVNATDSDLLAGVTATDREDGDITDSIIISSISSFNENMERTVTFAAFDKNGNVSQASRKITYSDYRKPKFKITESMALTTWSDTAFLSKISATDLIDGDVSGRITIDGNQVIDENIGEYEFTVSVTNSAGDVSTIVLHSNIAAMTRYIPRIDLNSYVVYIDKGTQFFPYTYVGDTYSGISEDELVNVQIEGTVDTNTEGMYLLVFYAVNSRGYTGQNYMTVIVE